MSKKIETAIKFTALAVMLGGLAACASAADPAALAVTTPPPATAKPFPQPLLKAMCVRTVTGGEKTNAMWVSKVDNDGFKTAVTSSMFAAGLLAPTADGCHFPVDINLLGLSQPSMGFDMTVTSHVNYKAYDSAGGPLVLATIDAPYTATVSDAFVGATRLKLANEGSIRMSISQFFDKLRDSTPK